VLATDAERRRRASDPIEEERLSAAIEPEPAIARESGAFE
jgi:hypothetical protein